MLSSTTYLNKQGQQVLENQSIYNTNFGFSGLQLSSIDGVQTIMENMESMNKNTDVQAIKNPQLDKLEKDFQKTLVEYNKAYKELSNDRLQRTQTMKKAKRYLGKVISEEDGNYYYVNDFGFTHKYSTDAWNNNNISCPKDIIDADSNLFREGPAMNSGQPCKVAGRNIRNETSGEAAWVDIKGYKHVYPEDVWDKKSKTCASKTIKLSDENYNLIPEGSPMSSTTICDTLDINPNVWIRIQKLNKKLISLAKKISREIEKLEIKDEIMRKMMDDQKKQIDVYVVNLDNDRKQLQFQKKTLETAAGREQNSELSMTSNLYNYLLMILFAIISVMITLRIINAESISTKTLFVGLILIIVGIYFIYQNAAFVSF